MSSSFPHRQQRRQLEAALWKTGALHVNSLALAVAAGQNWLLFWLTKHVRMVFAADAYGISKPEMLFDPDACALQAAYNRNRLVVQHMDPHQLRHEDNTFDLTVSLQTTAVEEICRVTKPGGWVVLTSEEAGSARDGLTIPSELVASKEMSSPASLFLQKSA